MGGNKLKSLVKKSPEIQQQKLNENIANSLLSFWRWVNIDFTVNWKIPINLARFFSAHVKREERFYHIEFYLLDYKTFESEITGVMLKTCVLDSVLLTDPFWVRGVCSFFFSYALPHHNLQRWCVLTKLKTSLRKESDFMAFQRWRLSSIGSHSFRIPIACESDVLIDSRRHNILCKKKESTATATKAISCDFVIEFLSNLFPIVLNWESLGCFFFSSS